jgi:uncharacterized membrane protein YhaH (DUF805 family)
LIETHLGVSHKKGYMMKYLFTPWAKAFNFTGRATRGEFFTYMLVSNISIFCFLVASIFGYVYLNNQVAGAIMNNGWLIWAATQIPMAALTFRRFNDALIPYVNMLWLLFPFFGLFVVSAFALKSSFVDGIVTLEDGTEMDHRDYILQRRKKVYGVVAMQVVAFTATHIERGQQNARRQQQNDAARNRSPKNVTPPGARILNQKGGLNRKTTIFGSGAHTRKGSGVKGSFNKFKF